MTSLIYIHIGNSLVNYLLDSIYQTILVNKYSVKIYVILSDSLILQFKELLKEQNLETVYGLCNFYNFVTVVPLSILEMSLLNNASKAYIDYKTYINKYSLSNFRDSFWISTTCRFFYIKEFIRLFLKGHRHILHIENDIMIYVPFSELQFEDKPGSIYMVKDSDSRVVPSILCFNDLDSIDSLTQFITSMHKK